ncbi:hypothetical protein DENSPDRAFT_841421 [Dentipellis sp. KUC8613]|nr:hypothetical protein DENSPDRAFT_841421 [Dentipellis sp. KUC8613]
MNTLAGASNRHLCLSFSASALLFLLVLVAEYSVISTKPSHSTFPEKSQNLAFSSALTIVNMHFSPTVFVLCLAVSAFAAPINHAEGSVNSNVTSSDFPGDAPVVPADDFKLREATTLTRSVARMSKRWKGPQTQNSSSPALELVNISSPALVSLNTTDASNGTSTDLGPAVQDVTAGNNESGSDDVTNPALAHAGVHLGEFVGFRR